MPILIAPQSYEPDDDQPQSAYDLYLSSSEWRSKRDRRLRLHVDIAPGMCWNCRTAPATQCHHITYDYCYIADEIYHGEESWWHLLPVCRQCHERIEQRKQEINQKRSDTAQVQSAIRRINWWALERYGESWWERVPLEEANREFQAYLEEQQQKSESFRIEMGRRQEKNRRKKAIKNLDFTRDVFYRSGDAAQNEHT